MTTKETIKETIEKDYPIYKDISDYLTGILLAMGYMEGDDYQIVIENPEEPTRVSVSLDINYNN